MNKKLSIDEQRRNFLNVIDYLKSTGLNQKEIAGKIGSDTIQISHIRSGTIKYIPPELIDNLHKKCNINPHYIIYGASNMFDTASLKYEHFDKFVEKWSLVEHEDKKYLYFTMDENFYKFLIDVYTLKETDTSSNTNAFTKTAESFYNALENHKKNTFKKDYLHFSNDNELYKFVLNVLDEKDSLDKTDKSDDLDDSKKVKESFDKILNFLKTNPPPAINLKEYVLIPADDVIEIAQNNISRRKSLAEVKDILHIYPQKNNQKGNGTV